MKNHLPKAVVEVEGAGNHEPVTDVACVHTAAQVRLHVLALALVVVGLASVYPLLARTTYTEGPGLYAINRIEGAIFGLAVGFIFLWRFRGLGNRYNLFVGLAFLANAVHDLTAGCLALANLQGWIMGPYSSLDRFVPGANVYGRLLMAVLILLAPLVATSESKAAGCKRELVWGMLITALVSALGTATAYAIPLPAFLSPAGPNVESADLALTLLFAAALAVLLRDYYRRRQMMTWWVAVCVGVNAVGQGLSAFSSNLYDAFFSIGNLYEVMSYAVPMVGLGVQHLAVTLERRRAETALRESEVRHRLLIEAMGEGLMVLDENGLISYVNKRVSEVMGYSRQELLGVSPLNLMDEDTSEALRRQLTWRGGERLSQEATWIGKRGETIHTIVSSVPIPDAEGTCKGTFAVITDITARKEAEAALQESNRRLHDALEELHRTQQQLIREQSLRALRQMGLGIAYDFRNTLTAVMGYTNLLLSRPEGLGNKEKVSRYLNRIQGAAEEAVEGVGRLGRIFRQRAEGDVFFPTDFNALVRRAISVLEPTVKDMQDSLGIAIELETDLRAIPPVPAHEFDLLEAISNILLNAVEAMPEGGKVSIRTQSDGKDLTLEISDTGVGMSEEALQWCFEPFYSTKGRRCAGMGLAIVHAAVRRHEGEVQVESQLGRGTTVRMRLPVAGPVRADATAVAAAA